MASLTQRTISSYLSVCSAILAIFSASLLIYYIIQMQVCENKKCLAQLDNLVKLLQSERRSHVMQVKQIQQSLNAFTKSKRQECLNVEILIDKLTMKVDKYKARCCTFNEKIKQQSETIKVLNSRIIEIETTLKKCKDDHYRQKEKNLQNYRIINELKQVISLQQCQNKEINLKISTQLQQIQALRSQISCKLEVQSRLNNVQFISQDQYQRQASLLRQNLKYEFNKTTSELFHFQPIKKETQCTDSFKTQIEENIHQRELRMLVNLAQYGSSFILDQQQSQFSLKDSKKILQFWKKLIKAGNYWQETIARLEDINRELSDSMNVQLTQMQQTINHQRAVTFASTQTPPNEFLQQLNQSNSLYRIKIIETQQLIALTVHFAAYLFQIIVKSHSQHSFYKRYNQKRQSKHKSINKFKNIAFSILFIQILKKKVKKSKKSSVKNIFENISEVRDSWLQRLLSKCLLLRQDYVRKNPVLQRIMRERAKITVQVLYINFINLIQQESIGLTLSKSHNIDLFNQSNLKNF